MKKITLILSLLPLFTSGQSSDITLDSLVNFYSESQKNTLPIHNGRLYYGYPQIIGDAFYPLPEWKKGSVMFEGHWYHAVSIMYDTYTDDVILLHPNSTPLVLYAGRIQAFNLDSLNFVRILPGKVNVLQPGFYQRVANGKVNLLIRRKKIIEENIADMKVERKFVSTPAFYIEKEGMYFPVTTKKALLNLLKDHKPELNRHIKYLRSQDISFKHDRETVITEIVNLYNQLPR